MNGFLPTFFQLLFNALYLAIIGRILMSFIDQTGQMRVTQILYEITEPILGPLRRIIPSVGFIDFSPMVAFLLLSVLQRIVVDALR
ncbi:MAG TPA: YggT family protein [Herpetosiphonaceae bacterium]